MDTDLGTSPIFGAVVTTSCIGEVNEEIKTAGFRVKKMLDIMALL